MSAAIVAAIASEVASAKAKITYNTAGGTIWSRLEQDAEMALRQLEVLYLPGSPHYRPPGTYLSRDFPYPARFADPAVTGAEGPLARFQGLLMKVEERIAARNAQYRVAYPFLLPSLVPTSINI